MTTAANTAAVAEALLGRCREMTEPVLRATVDRLPGSLRHVAGYHFGWWDQTGQPQIADSGKALRPALVLLAAQAVTWQAPSRPRQTAQNQANVIQSADDARGGLQAGVQARMQAALPAAVAVELVHNFSLIHDDVMDGDVMRRHRPTVWKVFGRNAAILVGNALMNLAFEVIASCGHPLRNHALHMLAAAVNDLLEGQAEDLAFERRDAVRLDECVRMAQRKTGALLDCSCGLGALFGGADELNVARLRAFGANLGLAFQLIDDLLGIWGDPARTGKPVYSDLRSRKKSLPVVAALASGSDDAAALAAAYREDRELSDPELARLAHLVDAAGGRDWCVSQADDLMNAALGCTEDAGLTALATYIISRDR